MTVESHDLTLRQLTRLAVLEPDRARSERVRECCRAAIAQRQRQGRPEKASGRLITYVSGSGLAYTLSVAYVSAMTLEVLRVFLRR
jgi:hypothetical protein